MVINSENAQEVESGEELDDIQWLKAKYGKILEREKELLDYLAQKFKNLDNRIKYLEKKFGEG